MAFATDPSASVKKQLEAALAQIVALEIVEQEIGAQLQDANEAGEVQADTISTLTEEVSMLEASAVAKDAALVAKEQELAEAIAARGEAMKAQADFDAKVEEAASRKALAITAAQGVPANLVPAAKPSDGTGSTVGTVEDLWAQYHAIPSAEGRTKFYNEHREEFLKAAR
jgi:hypothetical protein